MLMRRTTLTSGSVLRGNLPAVCGCYSDNKWVGEMPDTDKPAPGGVSPRDSRRPDLKKTFDPAMSSPGADAEAAGPHDEEGLKVARQANHKPVSSNRR